jgi:hypothetical protein
VARARHSCRGQLEEATMCCARGAWHGQDILVVRLTCAKIRRGGINTLAGPPLLRRPALHLCVKAAVETDWNLPVAEREAAPLPLGDHPKIENTRRAHGRARAAWVWLLRRTRRACARVCIRICCPCARTARVVLRLQPRSRPHRVGVRLRDAGGWTRWGRAHHRAAVRAAARYTHRGAAPQRGCARGADARARARDPGSRDSRYPPGTSRRIRGRRGCGTTPRTARRRRDSGERR